jgi:ABC-type nitrate/sulfonate/bicarbonate transport system substrate-binding protein
MKSFLEKNRDPLMRFLKGYIEAIHFLLKQNEETMRIFADYLNNRDRDVLGRFYEESSSRAEKELRPDPKSVRFMLDFTARRYPKAKSIGENEYTDLSLLDEIRRSGFLQQLVK